ncbi:hypothetical protein DVDV_3314 [Desulfovibrio sp. DV]|uniref:hypothetical protein n=1 Tax=Desulfovibrio sp. DV TaxID=1844708 RepID=UPI0009618F53|nr:hypothetical protein [Desulfovibrio sp. DV]OLN25495.1 hypothetical protein DVDV_3314 [Desulfovibrio sp. DV]
MASIGSIFLGSKSVADATLLGNVNSSIAFFLDIESSIDYIYRDQEYGWVVEIKKSQQAIVARSVDGYAKDDILAIGFELAQRALDMLSIEKNVFRIIPGPADSYVILFERESELVLQSVDVLNMPIKVSMEFSVYDKDGRHVPPRVLPPSVWSPQLRYYRLSQTSHDLYESYKNLFLSFESLLYSICPRLKSEAEKKWFERALGVIDAKVNLQRFAPPNAISCISYIVDKQYVQTRCRLFHGKGELPATCGGTISPKLVSESISSLLEIWREIAKNYLPINFKGESIVTYGGFKMMMDKVFAKEVSVAYSEDSTLPSSNDTVVSPLGNLVFNFDNVEYLGETSLGHVALLATQKMDITSKYASIHRTCTFIGDTLYSLGFNQDGITPDGVDVFENLQTFRLINVDCQKMVCANVI